MATATQRAYSRELDALIKSQYAQVGIAEREVARRIEEILDDLRRNVSAIAQGRFNAAATRQIIRGLEDSFAGLAADLSSDFRFLLDDTVRNGIDKLIVPMASVGFAGIPRVNISQNLVNVASRFTAGLISNDVLPEALARIEEILRRAALGGLPTGTAIRQIGGILPGAGPFGSINSRATTIFRTESLRMYSIVGQQQLESTARIVPGMRKGWLHTGIGVLHPRSGHVAYSGTVVDVNAFFVVAPTVGGREEQLRYPRDPLASAASTVSCACSAEEQFPGGDKNALDLQVLPLLAAIHKGDAAALAYAGLPEKVKPA